MSAKCCHRWLISALAVKETWFYQDIELLAATSEDSSGADKTWNYQCTPLTSDSHQIWFHNCQQRMWTLFHTFHFQCLSTKMQTKETFRPSFHQETLAFKVFCVFCCCFFHFYSCLWLLLPGTYESLATANQFCYPWSLWPLIWSLAEGFFSLGNQRLTTVANQSAPEEDCGCSDLIMYALLFHVLVAVRSQICSSNNHEKGFSSYMVNCSFLYKTCLVLCVFNVLAFYYFANFHIIFLHNLFCCIVALWNVPYVCCSLQIRV